MSEEESKKKKLNIIHKHLNGLSKLKTSYMKKWKSYRKIEDCFELVINVSNSITVSGIIITFAGSPIALIVSAVFSSVSLFASVVKRTLRITEKSHSYRLTWQQYNDLMRDLNVVLAKNHLTNSDLDQLILDLNHRLGLIEDNQLPITGLENLGSMHNENASVHLNRM